MQKAHRTQSRLNPDIEEKIKLVESGKIKGKTYTPDEYLKHIDQVLKD
ncbi:MAG: hypothetical protein K5785_06715 [Nitrosarchaeum sp.]|nr:hypothetical protein [Nitrosarchaeum sp.]